MNIHNYPVQGTLIKGTDWGDWDIEISPGVWQSQKFGLTEILDSFVTWNPSLFNKNIYQSDGTIFGEDRTVNIDGNTLSFVSGKVSIGDSTPFAPFRLHAFGDDTPGGFGNAIYAVANGSALFAVSSSGNTIVTTSGAGRGLTSFAPSNLIKKDSIGTLPSIDPSSILDVFTDDQGIRVFPRLDTSQRDAITTPSDHLMIENTDIGFPQTKHPVYNWQSIGYGRIELTIDFSDTPLNLGNSHQITVPTNIPLGKGIHKIVGYGDSIADPDLNVLRIGIDSDLSYFEPLVLDLNASYGAYSSKNSNRSVSPNENITIEYLSSVGDVDSGVLHLTIFHT